MDRKINIDHTQLKPVVIKTSYFQAAFWVILTFVTFFSLTLWYGSAQWPHVFHTLLQSILGLLLTLPMQWIYRKIWSWRAPYFFPFVLLVVLLFSLLWSALRIAAFIWLTEEGSEVWADFGGWYFSGFFIFLCWSAIYYGLHLYRVATEEKDRRVLLVEKSRSEKVKRLEAEKLAADSRMQMLRYQLNPHFLFNTLNAINALVVTNDHQLAREMIDKLSQFLRFALKDEESGWVSLKREIDALDLYLAIEKVRFDDRLEVEYQIEDQALKYDVPSLLLQPLVENTIKHAINVREEGGVITISASYAGGFLLISVSDDGPGISSLDDGEYLLAGVNFSGVGLKNILNRIESLYGGEASVHLVNRKNNGLEIKFRLPVKHR